MYYTLYTKTLNLDTRVSKILVSLMHIPLCNVSHIEVSEEEDLYS